MTTPEACVAQLDDFDFTVRRRALEALLALELPVPASSREVNLHAHTFFSYNACGFSPTRLCWEAKQAGLFMLATVDFDVLDAMEEVFAAGDALGLPAAAGLETRVFVEAYAAHELSSPGEPGIAYFMGTGFVRQPRTEAGQATLRRMAEQAGARNRAMLARLNAFLGDVQLDYERDVLPLTPAGNATERHMLEAFEVRSAAVFGEDGAGAAAFWAEKFGLEPAAARAVMAESNRFRDTLRARLMKKGGVGYAAPDRTTFPSVEEVIAMIQSAGAIPTITWLDGTSSGEADGAALIDCLVAKGCEALNIIPDRNWCIADGAEKARKVAKFHEIVALCRQRHLPVLVGTEMNKAGQKFVDTFDAPEMAVVAEDFYRGAEFLYGHTLMARARSQGRLSPWADAHFSARSGAVDFYAAVGRAAAPPAVALAALQGLPEDATPEAIRAALRVC